MLSSIRAPYELERSIPNVKNMYITPDLIVCLIQRKLSGHKTKGQNRNIFINPILLFKIRPQTYSILYSYNSHSKISSNNFFLVSLS